MTRTEFLTQLRDGLRGLPESRVAALIADYETRFSHEIASGCPEAEVAVAMGDPKRLARELRAEAGAARWRNSATPGHALTVMFAVIGLGALDLLILLPILIAVAAALLGFVIASLGAFVAGGVIMSAGPFADPSGGPFAAVLAGIGVMASATCMLALLSLMGLGVVNLTVWYGRLHYRLLKVAA